MAKKLKLKVPKRVAGVKMPKAVRKGSVAKFLNSSAGQLLLAEALVVLGGALTAEKLDSDSGPADLVAHSRQGMKKAGRLAPARSAGVADNIARDSGRLSFALNEAIRAFRAALDRYQPEVQETTQAEDTVSAGEVQSESVRAKKKAASSPTETPSMPH